MLHICPLHATHNGEHIYQVRGIINGVWMLIRVSGLLETMFKVISNVTLTLWYVTGRQYHTPYGCKHFQYSSDFMIKGSHITNYNGDIIVIA